MKKIVDNLKRVSFPRCTKNCAAVEILGVGECKNVCMWKFNMKGKAIKNIVYIPISFSVWMDVLKYKRRCNYGT